MATTDNFMARDMHKSIINAFVAIALLLGIAGCSVGNNTSMELFNLQQEEMAAQNQSNIIASEVKGSVVITPLVGPPDSIAGQLIALVSQELSKRSIKVIDEAQNQSAASKSSDYILRGYVVAASETAGVKVSYIWDISNPLGKRVHRITGEQVIRNLASNDPWSSISGEMISRIAVDTASAVSKWFPQKPTSIPAGQLVAQTAPVPTSSVSSASSVGRKTGSIPTRTALLGSSVYVPRVVGAPGDGSSALSIALQDELRKSGLTLVDSATRAAHTIEGSVVMGQAASGKQPIKIDWVVKSSAGTRIGTVSQKNQIPAGSLNKKWGMTAKAAASAAAQGIIRLLPRKTAMKF